MIDRDAFRDEVALVVLEARMQMKLPMSVWERIRAWVGLSYKYPHPAEQWLMAYAYRMADAAWEARKEKKEEADGSS